MFTVYTYAIIICKNHLLTYLLTYLHFKAVVKISILLLIKLCLHLNYSIFQDGLLKAMCIATKVCCEHVKSLDYYKTGR